MPRLTFQLLMNLVEVIEVHMGITQGVDEPQRLEPGHRGHQMGKQGI